MWFFILAGIILFLIMEHPIIFWVVFVPMAVSFVYYICKFLGRGRFNLKDLATAFFILFAMGVALWIVCLP